MPLRRLLGAKGKAADHDEPADRRGARLDGKRKHLRAQIADNQRELRVLWTDYRRSDDRSEKKSLKRKIRVAEAERKKLMKQMRKLQAEMEKLGYKTQAGHVDVH